MKLEPECGVTSISLRNAETLLWAYGTPAEITLSYHEQADWFRVTVTWTELIHIFTGFSWGYLGTGPHGLEAFFKMVGVETGLNEIASWPDELGRTISMTPGQPIDFPSDPWSA
ncbi:MAG TPA: hypothetical protein VI911_09800 [Patescibacteria group bacterium]|nr:hypothetical protein [Patescibacteria group bacterium]